MIHERGSGSALITIAIVSQNQLLRLGLQAVIAPHAHIRLIGEATNMLQAVSIVTQEKPQLLIIELQPGMDILGLVRKVKASLSTIRIITRRDPTATRSATSPRTCRRRTPSTARRT